MSEPTNEEREAEKQGIRNALVILEHYIGNDGKINMSALTDDAIRYRWLKKHLIPTLSDEQRVAVKKQLATIVWAK